MLETCVFTQTEPVIKFCKSKLSEEDNDKTYEEILSEEKNELLRDIRKKAKKRKAAMNPDSETGNEYVK